MNNLGIMTIKQRLRRRLARFIRKHDVVMGQRQWARRFAGGKWEWWMIESINDCVWVAVDHWTTAAKLEKHKTLKIFGNEEYFNYA